MKTFRLYAKLSTLFVYTLKNVELTGVWKNFQVLHWVITKSQAPTNRQVTTAKYREFPILMLESTQALHLWTGQLFLKVIYTIAWTTIGQWVDKWVNNIQVLYSIYILA